jgi:predicted nucleic acid-binding protein
LKRRKKYVLDTNVYIMANRDREFADGLVAFYEVNLPFTYLHAVVVQELLLGASDSRALSEIHAAYVAPFESRGRVVTPAYQSWKRSGESIAKLIERRLLRPGSISRSFLNDALLAASCRDEGMTIVTANVRDFKRLSEVMRFHYVEPWPR